MKKSTFDKKTNLIYIIKGVNNYNFLWALFLIYKILRENTMMVRVLRIIDVLKHFLKKKVLFSSLVRGVSASLFSGIKKAVFSYHWLDNLQNCLKVSFLFRVNIIAFPFVFALQNTLLNFSIIWCLI